MTKNPPVVGRLELGTPASALLVRTPSLFEVVMWIRIRCNADPDPGTASMRIQMWIRSQEVPNTYISLKESKIDTKICMEIII